MLVVVVLAPVVVVLEVSPELQVTEEGAALGLAVERPVAMAPTVEATREELAVAWAAAEVVAQMVGPAAVEAVDPDPAVADTTKVSLVGTN